MKPQQEELIPTRASLIKNLRNWQDQASWNDFFNVYWRLIYGVARKSGLADDEAQEVVQETLIGVAKHMPTFRYDPSIGSFKAWLLNMTRWRILGQLRKRRPLINGRQTQDGSTTDTSPTNNIPDPNIQSMEAVWENDWQTNLLTAALDNIRRKLDPQKYQIFDFLVNKEWPPAKVAQSFGVSVDLVYQIKHRVTEALKTEVERLEQEMT